MKSYKSYLLPLTLGLLTLGIYALGFNNELVFDDARLTDGTVSNAYGSLLQFKQRVLSYGSFVWVDELSGASLVAQRIVNLLLHAATCVALFALFSQLLNRVETHAVQDAAKTQTTSIALQVGVGLFALHPVATYAVGYLIQRSIVMATLFGVLACHAYVRGLLSQRASAKTYWFAWSLVAYVCAVASKEHVFLIAGMSVPLYIFVQRPTWQRATAAIVLAGTVVGVALVALLRIYPHLLGEVFDETSRQLVAQLDRQRPGAATQIFPLSLLNQAALFFYYGFLWLVPAVGWMSIDMRPPFPLTLTSLPHIGGAIAYIVVLLLAVWAVLRRSDIWGFIGLCLLFPLVLFWTEFSTVWVQDPMVLYRSYLWAIPVPGLIAVALKASGFSNRTLYGAGIAAVLVLAALSAERLSSLRTPLSVWSDAVEKIDVKNGAPNAVGRYRAFLNRGAQYLDRFSAELATTDFRTAHALGEPTGGALFNLGLAEQVQKKHAEALRSFATAESAGYQDGPLHFHRAESQYALGQYKEAVEGYSQALVRPLADKVKEQAQLRRAESQMRLGNFSEAAADFEALVKLNPGQPRHLTGLGMAKLGLEDGPGAKAVFEQVLTRSLDARQAALAHYGKAMAHAMLKNASDARAELTKAVELDPQNATYLRLQQMWAKEVRLPRDPS
ncbi:MAG: tetratricopeptide repeat protein [Hydrogenophaga sp.]|nr:tetratricopeptide repeat protein [Hydrogenophaga sp.]